MISQTSDFFNRCAFYISILNIKILPFLLQTFYGGVYSIYEEFDGCKFNCTIPSMLFYRYMKVRSQHVQL